MRGGRMAKIVLVDDDDYVRSAMVDIIKALEYEVYEIKEPQEVNEEMIEDINPDLIICDFTMPGKNGLQVFETIVKVFPKTRFLILSGGPGSDQKNQTDFLEAEQIGLTILRKPVSIAILKKTIENALMF